MHQTSDLHVVETRQLRSPETLHEVFPLDCEVTELVTRTRSRIRDIIADRDRRLLAIVGPCSIHDVDAALEYGQKLLPLRQELSDRLEIVMRVYFEKPRTSVGWKGLINDPHLDNSYDINTGLRRARSLLLDLAKMGVPAATELLDPIVPQYIADLISWTAIGARTTESQTHRQMASGLSMPVGYKNATDGSLDSAINAILASRIPHHFLGIDMQGHASIVTTTGNPDGHLVLRGGRSGPNYDATHINAAAHTLAMHGLAARVMVDCSHGNSQKSHERQVTVLDAVAAEVETGLPPLMGVMIESHLVAGKQKLPDDLSTLTYGQSITDACVDFETTATMLRSLASAVAASPSFEESDARAAVAAG
ncbi:MAG: 3-deoxy-7-phosphoheptulonate synthase [Cyanobacteria bacterium J06639_1]